MIFIKKNEINEVVLELDCLHNLVNPFYLFEFISEINNTKIYFTSPNMSNYKNRYDEFIIEDDNSLNIMKTNDTAYIDDIPFNFIVGQYIYNIYVSELAIDVNDLSTILESKIISTGKTVVDGINESNNVDSIYL